MTETELWILLGVFLLAAVVWVFASRGPKPEKEMPAELPVDPTLQATLDAMASIRQMRLPWRPECFWVNPDQKALTRFSELSEKQGYPPYAGTSLAALTGIPIRPSPMVPSMMLMYKALDGGAVFLDFRSKDEEQK